LDLVKDPEVTILSREGHHTMFSYSRMGLTVAVCNQ